jgi:kynurenine formamidase
MKPTLLALIALCAAAQTIDVSKAVDLTHTFDKDTIYWPTSDGFHWKETAWGKSEGGFWYTSANYAANEHGGTHLDSPIHFHETGATTDQIPLSKLIAPAVVVDISPACARNPDYRLSVADLTGWEKRHGRIPNGSILLVRTGWGTRWPDKKKYMGTDKPGDVANLRFPGLSREAAEFLTTQRRINGVGIDTASLDYGPSKDFIAHRILMGAGLFGLENVANLERLPPTGATLIALPMKIKGGTGGPARIIAILP